MSPRRTYFPADLRADPAPRVVEVEVRARPADVVVEAPKPREPKRRTLPDLQPWLKRECQKLWDVHEAHSRQAKPAVEWPRRSTFRLNWPQLEEDLVVAAWKIRQEQEDSGTLVAWLDEQPEAGERLEVLMPAPAPQRDWATKYAAELAEAPAGLHLSLVKLSESDVGNVGRAIEWLMKRLRELPAEEQAALRLYLGGESWSAIARSLSRRYRRNYNVQRVQRLLDVDEIGRPRALRHLMTPARAQAV
jgi:hypothetical protein